MARKERAYHSSYIDEPHVPTIGNVALLPINTKIRGPAPHAEDPTRPDIIEESLDLFRANCLFRNFEIKGPADRLLIYFILFISDCINKLAPPHPSKPAPTYPEAIKSLSTLAVDHFSLPGDAGFPMNNLYHGPKDRNEADALRSYLLQCRQELAIRLCDRLYPVEPETQPDGTPTPANRVGQRQVRPSKWWMAFQKRKFMGMSLSG
ncbi:hypothetical protein QFC21_004781 [Naganishia friedmannii]|uniref:Uncharacterized protein n=1 Tax=Naganishia friedmannii TaxID=89922 RepID=A0ACC2VFB6_9TREE|nr:hypothetical protein QFC21_004781 [Naganishia friedmannii]